MGVAEHSKKYSEECTLASAYNGIAHPFPPNQSRSLWDHIEAEFQREILPDQLALTEEFTNFKHQDGEDATTFLPRFDKLLNHLSPAGIPQQQNTQFLRLIQALPKSFDALNLIINGNNDVQAVRRLIRI